MSKLYIFGIGGTGSRVLKSLTMLLAAGVKIDCTEIVPIIIDPDSAAGDLTKTVELIRQYKRIQKDLTFAGNVQNKFYKTDFNLDIAPEIVMRLANVENKQFKDYIGFDSLDPANKALTSMLFSEHNLKTNMEVGFKGNPNIGSVVLNQFQNAEVFKKMVASFKQGDRIFVISSIFGGTGASGFPLLVKNLRAVDDSISGFHLVKNAPIGAISVLPYFSLLPNADSEIDSSTFLMKTKAALKYYDGNLNEVNVHYYIADAITKQYDNVEGGSNQRNDAHIVELMSALSIIDFMSIPDDDMIVDNGVPSNVKYKEYGFKRNLNDNESVIFGDLEDDTLDLIKKPLSQFTLYSKYLREQYHDSIGKQPYTDIFDRNFSTAGFYKTLKQFVDSYIDWVEEMGNNNRSFKPFELDVAPDKLFSYIRDVVPDRRFFGKKNYELFNDKLNDAIRSLNGDANIEQRFVELFFVVTEKLLKSELKMN